MPDARTSKIEDHRTDTFFTKAPNREVDEVAFTFKLLPLSLLNVCDAQLLFPRVVPLQMDPDGAASPDNENR